MKYLVVLVGLLALCAGAFAEVELDEFEVEEIDVTSPEPEVDLCPQTLIDLYRVSRNSCIDEIRANRTDSRGQANEGATTEDPASATDDIVEEIQESADDEQEEDGDAEHVEDNRSRRASDPRLHRARGRNNRGSRRRKQFFRQFKSCLVNKLKDNSIVTELQTTCVSNCTSVNAAWREAKERKCVLKKLKQRCPDIVPARRPRINRRNRHNNISRHQD